MNQSFAKIGWDVQRPVYTFEPEHTQLHIQQKTTEMIFHRTQPVVQIDQSQCWADMDIKSNAQQNAELAADGHQSALAYIARVAAEGEQLGAIENKGNAIANIAKGKKFFTDHQFSYANVPGNFSLHLNGIPGQLNIECNQGGTAIDVQQTPSAQNYEKGKINYYIRQKNQLSIQVSGDILDASY
ncbi:DUF6470 family protein [Aneurinibacillus sp. Ricciae_BoGa-3]|uniref:DUF6470 family protein n=1 Tax=Aneurinibacillus sp. Ricciae_BoGa-3 TaxID=3022697 RepID=UPI0023425416|nr:DUF6470 family protein [Aneurinibacillus sp. Ricciae_BoGa-3]WCK54198.1 DUF6470 family protein [Aneurinibacillus sp. Ricciae_BoGa-3]